MGSPLSELLELVRYKELLKNLVTRDIKVRYKRSVLGFLWVMLNPLLMMLILSMVFSELFKVSTKNYTAYLLSGIVFWNLFSQSTSTSVVSLIGNSNLIKKIYIPKAIFPLSVIVSAAINFIFSLVPLFIVLYFTGAPLGSHIYLLPVVVLLVVLFSYGISLFLSTMTVFFHDTIYIYEVLLMAWMYVTPIFYPESIIPQKYTFVLYLNPFYYFLGVFRDALYMNLSFPSEKLLYSLAFAVTAVVAGWLFYARYKDRVIYYL